MKYICLFLFACISIISKAQTLILSENDSTVMTEYNDGNLWAYRNANVLSLALRLMKRRMIMENIIGLMFSSRISVIRRSYLYRTMLLLIC